MGHDQEFPPRGIVKPIVFGSLIWIISLILVYGVYRLCAEYPLAFTIAIWTIVTIGICIIGVCSYALCTTLQVFRHKETDEES
ncbi:MAG: hypothetical protein RIT04_13 [Candidatus Parcubacteria bacterium]|jgi:hypothetical protein